MKKILQNKKALNFMLKLKFFSKCFSLSTKKHKISCMQKLQVIEWGIMSADLGNWIKQKWVNCIILWHGELSSKRHNSVRVSTGQLEIRNSEFWFLSYTHEKSEIRKFLFSLFCFVQKNSVRESQFQGLTDAFLIEQRQEKMRGRGKDKTAVRLWNKQTQSCQV